MAAVARPAALEARGGHGAAVRESELADRTGGAERGAEGCTCCCEGCCCCCERALSGAAVATAPPLRERNGPPRGAAGAAVHARAERGPWPADAVAAPHAGTLAAAPCLAGMGWGPWPATREWGATTARTAATATLAAAGSGDGGGEEAGAVLVWVAPWA